MFLSVSYRLDQQFEAIHKRIQETPKSTEQLFKLMEYVEDVRRITVHRLAEEVADMVSKLKVISVSCGSQALLVCCPVCFEWYVGMFDFYCFFYQV